MKATTTRITRRNLIAIGAAFPLSTLVARSAAARAAAQNGHDHGNATPGASPEASPMANTGTGAIYLTIQNNGSDADTVLSAKTDAAQSAEIHDMSMEGGIMKMQPMPEGVEIPAGGTLSFEPQGLHIMLVNLNHNLNPGTTYNLTLTFAKAGDVTVPISVQTDAPETSAHPVTIGDITIAGAWSRPAPRISGGSGHDMHGDSTPEATPSH